KTTKKKTLINKIKYTGNADSNDGCSSVCAVEYCGDGIINNITEQCDDRNDLSGDGCVHCMLEYCGDGVINNNGHEECDDGNEDQGDSCYECKLEKCGDGIVNNNGI